MIRRHELSDAEWEFVRPLLPASLRGRKRLDDRRVLNGIVWKFRTGTARRDVPERCGSWATLHTRFCRWAKDGTFERTWRAGGAPIPSTIDPGKAEQTPAPGVQAVRTVARSTWTPGTTPAPRSVGRRRTGWELGLSGGLG
ncbi:transposase [Streptomyces sp. NPDC056601]